MHFVIHRPSFRGSVALNPIFKTIRPFSAPYGEHTLSHAQSILPHKYSAPLSQSSSECGRPRASRMQRVAVWRCEGDEVSAGGVVMRTAGWKAWRSSTAGSASTAIRARAHEERCVGSVLIFLVFFRTGISSIKSRPLFDSSSNRYRNTCRRLQFQLQEEEHCSACFLGGVWPVLSTVSAHVISDLSEQYFQNCKGNRGRTTFIKPHSAQEILGGRGAWRH